MHTSTNVTTATTTIATIQDKGIMVKLSGHTEANDQLNKKNEL